MSLSLENVNVSRVFVDPLDIPITHSRTLLLDALEFVWGLNRGQMSSYFDVPGNFLGIQPELKEAICTREVALIPPNHIVDELYEFQEQNSKLPFAKRRAFTEVSSFEPFECRVIPLKPGVSLYTLNPKTRRVSPLKGTCTTFPSVSCGAHPFFVLTYACYGLVNPSKTVRRKLALMQPLIQCIGPWHMAPSFEFFKGAYIGQFNRPIPYKYRPLLPTTPPVLDPSSSLDSEPSSKRKRSRLSISPSSDSEAGVDIVKWVLDCTAVDLPPDADGPTLEVVPCKPLDSPKAVGRVIPKRKRSEIYVAQYL